MRVAEEKCRFRIFFRKSGERKHSRALFPVGKTAGKVILSRLRDDKQARRQLFQLYITRHAVKNFVSYFGEFTHGVAENLAVYSFGKIK